MHSCCLFILRPSFVLLLSLFRACHIASLYPSIFPISVLLSLNSTQTDHSASCWLYCKSFSCLSILTSPKVHNYEQHSRAHGPILQKRNQETESNMSQETDSFLLRNTQWKWTCSQTSKQLTKDSSMRRKGEVRASCKHAPRKAPVVWFGRSKRGRDALGCVVMQAPGNYLQPYREALGYTELSLQKHQAQIKPDKYISVIITKTELYTMLIRDKNPSTAYFSEQLHCSKRFKCPWWQPWGTEWLDWVLMCADLIYTETHIIAVRTSVPEDQAPFSPRWFSTGSSMQNVIFDEGHPCSKPGSGFRWGLTPAQFNKHNTLATLIPRGLKEKLAAVLSLGKL